MSEPLAVRRPGGITVVAVFAYISGVLDVVGGALILILTAVYAATNRVPGPPLAVTVAIVTLIVGMITLAVASGLLRGRRGARTIVTVLQIISIVSSLLSIFAQPSTMIGEIVSIIVALVVVVLLYAGRANVFFGSASR
jgi:Na+/melibiose symporter-like transporter